VSGMTFQQPYLPKNMHENGQQFDTLLRTNSLYDPTQARARPSMPQIHNGRQETHQAPSQASLLQQQEYMIQK